MSTTATGWLLTPTVNVGNCHKLAIVTDGRCQQLPQVGYCHRQSMSATATSWLLTPTVDVSNYHKLAIVTDDRCQQLPQVGC